MKYIYEEAGSKKQTKCMKKPVRSSNWLNKNRQPILVLDRFIFQYHF